LTPRTDMAGKTKKETTERKPRAWKFPESCAECPVRIKQRKVIYELVEKLGEQLKEGKETKVSVGDYIRLLQVQKEIEEQEPREIQVTWIEPSTQNPASEK